MLKKRLFLLLTAIFVLFGVLYSSADTFPASGKITGDRVYIRAGNSQKYEPLTTFDKETKITVLALKGEYYLIKCPAGVPGWIYSKYVEIKGTTAVVTATNVNIRAKAKTGTVICKVSRPTKLKVIQKQNDWVRIEAPSSAKVYIHKKFVKLLPKVAEVTPKPIESTKATPKPTPKPSTEWKDKNDAAIAAYDKERAKSILESDFNAVAKLFQTILNSSAAKEFHSEAKLKIALCNFYVKQQAAYKELKDKNKDLERRLEELKKELDKKLKEIEEERAKNKKTKEEEKYLATGTIFSLGGIINRPATHKLFKGEKVIFLLKSSTINLDDYWGKYVGVKGTISPPPEGWKFNIITVTEIKVLDDSKRRPKPRR